MHYIVVKGDNLVILSYIKYCSFVQVYVVLSCQVLQFCNYLVLACQVLQFCTSLSSAVMSSIAVSHLLTT